MPKLQAVILLLLLSSTTVVADTNYAFGHGALDVFGSEGFAVTPTWVQVWVPFMLLVFAMGLLFVWKHAIARWVVGGLITSLATGQYVFDTLGLPFLGGSIAIMHLVCWSPALVLLLLKRPFSDEREPRNYRIWSALITAVIMFSFIFDVRDAVVYISHISSLS